MIKQYPYDYYRTFPYGDPQKYPITNYTFEPAEEWIRLSVYVVDMDR